MYILKTGCSWYDLPPIFLPKSSIYDRFIRWINEGIFEKVYKKILEILTENSMKCDVVYVDATFIKGVLVNEDSKPIAVLCFNAKSHEITLVKSLISDCEQAPIN